MEVRASVPKASSHRGPEETVQQDKCHEGGAEATQEILPLPQREGGVGDAFKEAGFSRI